ncbi:MAG: fibronectin type III domain-containing protein [Anaerolineales bacterium]|nr:fibronectin type III domain-containing protein [Anaerolineales bacterium]
MGKFLRTSLGLLLPGLALALAWLLDPTPTPAALPLPVTNLPHPTNSDLPVSAWVSLSGAAEADLNERPQRFWFVQGAEAALEFTASTTLPGGELEMRLDLPPGVTLLAGQTAWRGVERAHRLPVRLRFDQTGEYRLSGMAIHLQSGFHSASAAIVRVVASQAAARAEAAAICPSGLCGRARVTDGVALVDGRQRDLAEAPEGTAHIYGVAVTYPFTDTRQYPLRGLQIELWQDVSGGPDVQLGSMLHTKEQSTEGRCGLEVGDNYVQGSTWYTVGGENAGMFDFGNLEMGAGKQLYFKITYVFADGGTGVDGSGTAKIVVKDISTGSAVFITHESARFWAYSGNSYLKFVSPPALGTAGTVADEAAHVYYDLSRMYGYMRDCVGLSTGPVETHLNLPDTNGAYSAGGMVYYPGSTDGYLTYQPTSIIAHEYAHSIHYFMRGASYPPYDPAGYPPVVPPDTWHGNCANTTSAGGLTEGWADFTPAFYYDDPVFRWGTGSSTYNISLNTGAFAECENSEWTFAAILWDLWKEVSEGDDSGFDQIAATLEAWDPDFIRDFYDAYHDDWNVCYPTWTVFDNHSVTYPTCPPPAAPSGLSASSSWQDQVYLTWTDNSSTEDDFLLERSPDGSTGWSFVDQTEDTWYYDINRVCGTTYYYRARAARYGDWTFSSYSNTASATTAACPPPAAPNNLVATALSSSQIGLTWTDNSSDESDFRIERSPNGSSSWSEVTQVDANTTSWTNGGLACATPYYYRVRAHRSSDSTFSSYSYTASATTQSCAALSPPSNLSAEAMSTSRIDLTWADNSTNESNFRLERSYDGVSGWTEIATNPADDVTYSDTGLSAATPYYYRVRAYRSSDSSYSDYSNVASAVTYYTAFLAPDYLNTHVISPSQIDINWTDRTFDESDFHIERSLDGASWSQIATVGANVNSYSSTGLDCDTLYYYRVRAHRQNDSTYSGYSPVDSARTQICPAGPRAPSDLTAIDVTETSLQFTWTDNSSDESDFHLERSAHLDYGWIEVGYAAANGTWAAVEGVCGSTYYYRVRAHRHSDDSSGISAHVYQPTWPCGWNDDFWLAFPVSPLPFTRIQSIDGATTAVDDPGFTCVSGQRYHSVWFSYAATTNATLTVNTFASTYDTVLAVWTGFPGGMTSQACNDNSGGSQSQVSLSQVKGTTYYIEVASMTLNPTFKSLVLGAALSGADSPVLTSLLPDWKAAGMPDFTLTVYGENFINGMSTVRWNGSNRPTTFKSGAKLEAAITAADIASVGSGSVTVYNGSAGGGTSNALSLAVVAPNPFDISAGSSTSPPTVDGLILPAEWAGAQTYDIAAPPYVSLLEAPSLGQVFDWLGLLSAPLELTQPLSAVTLYVKNDASHLYLAFDNPNDTTQSASDNVLIYFDDTPLPSDGLWNFSAWCPSEAGGEGYFQLTPSLKRFSEYCSTGVYPAVENAPGLESAFGISSGHLQAEISIDLATSALNLAPGQTVGMYLLLRDNYVAQGVWPNNAVGSDPSTFRSLALALAKVFLPVVVR